MNLVSLTGHRYQSLLAAPPAGPAWVAACQLAAGFRSYRISCIQPVWTWTRTYDLFWYLYVIVLRGRFKKNTTPGGPNFQLHYGCVVFLLLATGCQAERNVRHNPQRLFINVVALGFLGKQRWVGCVHVHIYVNMNMIIKFAGEIAIRCEIMQFIICMPS